ncbi:MAG: hypothetical protein HN465_06200 [Nitrospina sp.]|nr:hypothetical protein [Nitrospina sp.]MBT4260386.1 hypothetical protein [Nitrospina sp.]MBT5258691.1 hypothetical protein [Nitrospina sp.]
MLNNRRFKFFIVAVGIMLWLPPHEVIGEDTEIKNQLSYVSKIVGVIEGSLIKIEGNVRFIKRQAEKRIVESNVSVKRLDNLEEKIKNTENLLGTIALEVAKINESMQRTEKKMKYLSRRACSNAILCERKK